MRKYRVCTDSVLSVINSEAVAQMNALYNYEYREKENATLKQENARKTYLLFILLSLCVIAALTIYALLEFNKRKKVQYQSNLRQLEQLQKIQYQQSSEYIAEQDAEIKLLKERLSLIAGENHKLTDELSRKLQEAEYTRQLAILRKNDKEQVDKSIMASATCHRILDMAEKGLHLKKEDWNEIQTLIEDHYPSFQTQLENLVNCSSFEYHICLLVKLQILPSQMVTLTAHSKSAISSVRSRLYEKAFGRKGSSREWDKYIHSIGI